jgi:predicted dehydrogenase
MSQSKVGVGVIGVGGISGHVHLPGLQLCPQAEIVALCDLNPDLLRQRAEEYGVVARASRKAAWHDLCRDSTDV